MASSTALILVDKPAGIVRSQKPSLQCVLDLETFASGVTLFSSEASAAQPDSITYWFLTRQLDQPYQDTFFAAKSEFSRVKCNPYVALWAVRTLETSAQKVLKLAAENHLPVLGDHGNGGDPFLFTALHRLSVVARDGITYEAPAPRLFERLGLTVDSELVRALTAIDLRERIFRFLANPEICICLSHDEIADLRLELLGPVLWLSVYREQFSKRDMERWTLVGWILGRSIYVRMMQNRGQDPHARKFLEIGTPVPERWTAVENGMTFLFKKSAGLSAGLFLDQRKNRALLRADCSDRRVLNLFAYTGGFTVAALLGGATQVTHVDLSASHIEWAKENLALNHLEPSRVRWIKDNCVTFLSRLKKRGEKFDWIICDPPSFSRDGKNVFRLENDFKSLVGDCLDLLNPGGKLLFSTNSENQSRAWFEKEIKDFLRRHFQRMCSLRTLEGDLDFEINSANPRLKSFCLTM